MADVLLLCNNNKRITLVSFFLSLRVQLKIVVVVCSNGNGRTHTHTNRDVEKHLTVLSVRDAAFVFVFAI